MSIVCRFEGADPLPSGTSDCSSCGSVLSLEPLSAVSSMISGLDGQETRDSWDSDHVTTNPSEAFLPPFSPLPLNPVFSWGDVDGGTFCNHIDEAYQTIVQWRRNIFELPYGEIGKDFISEMSKCIKGYANDAAMKCVTLKVALVMPPLLLQHPHSRSKSKGNKKCLERHLS